MEKSNTINTSLFIGDLDPTVTEDEIRKALRRHLRSRKNLEELKLCHNEKKNKKMLFFVSEDYETVKSLVTRPIFIREAEHYCQISQTYEDSLQFDFQRKCLFVSNVPFSVKESQFKIFFSKFGEVESCYIIKKKGKSKGYGFVYFAEEKDAKALLKRESVILGGKNIYLRPYKQKTKKERNPGSQQPFNQQIQSFGLGLLMNQIGFGGNPGGDFNEHNDIIYQLMLQNFMLQMQVQDNGNAYGFGQQNRNLGFKGRANLVPQRNGYEDQRPGGIGEEAKKVHFNKNTKNEILMISRELRCSHNSVSENLRFNKL